MSLHLCSLVSEMLRNFYGLMMFRLFASAHFLILVGFWALLISFAREGEYQYIVSHRASRFSNVAPMLPL